MKNPFEYRLIAKGKEFIDREYEMRAILQALKSGQNITIYSPRRYGKSSLILSTLDSLSDHYDTVYIDFNKINSVSELADRLISSTTESSYSSLEQGFSFVRDTLLSLRPTFTPTKEGSLSISVKLVDRDEDLEKALKFPQKVAEKKDTDLIVAMDEFQRIRNLNGDTLERLFRSIIQEQDKVTYLFSGSQIRMLQQMFESGDRPFFKSTKIMKLGKIPNQDFKEYILQWFEETGLEIDYTLVDEILDLTDGHPMRTKQICFEVWNRKQTGEPGPSLDQVLDVMIENDIYIEEVWNSINSAVQRRVLEALVNEEKPYSHETIERYDLKGSSHVQRAIKSLEKKGILYEEQIVDPFLKEWIKRESR
ncbi:MAG: AAA family ATPase [Candidatus Natronoplasma sp.]